MNERVKGIFGMLDGFPAQIAVVLGFLLVLLGGTLPSCAVASYSAASAALDRATQLVELDLQQLRTQQEAERHAAQQAAAAGQPTDPTLPQRQEEALRVQRQQLETQQGIVQLRRDAVEAYAAARSARIHYVIDWIGRLLLILGLLVLAVCAEGRTQAVLASVLVVVLLGSLAGLELGIGVGRQSAPPPLAAPPTAGAGVQ